MNEREWVFFSFFLFLFVFLSRFCTHIIIPLCIVSGCASGCTFPPGRLPRLAEMCQQPGVVAMYWSGKFFAPPPFLLSTSLYRAFAQVLYILETREANREKEGFPLFFSSSSSSLLPVWHHIETFDTYRMGYSDRCPLNNCKSRKTSRHAIVWWRLLPRCSLRWQLVRWVHL